MTHHTIAVSYVTAALDALDARDAELSRAARLATERAYAPYSNFHVGAAAWVAGRPEPLLAANVENAAFPQCICAEAALIAAANATEHGRPIEAIAIAIASSRAQATGAAPCGSCRQQLFETEVRQGGSGIRLLLVGSNDEVRVFESCAQLLPLGFVLAA